MEDVGTIDVTSDHRMKTSPEKRNMYLVDVTLLNNVMFMAACRCVEVGRQVSRNGTVVLCANQKQTNPSTQSSFKAYSSASSPFAVVIRISHCYIVCSYAVTPYLLCSCLLSLFLLLHILSWW